MILQSESIPEPFFADTERGRRFAIVNRPHGSPRGGVLFVPPFAEEMNKSRRMAALTAAALARDGWLVLRFDLHGCGDSDGDFADATWQGWVDDVSFWADWLHGQIGGPLVLWTLRAGALLVSAWLNQTAKSLPLMLWQPVSNGQRYITQFLRLHAAAEMMDARQAKGAVSRLRETLLSGSAVTVAGYILHPELANPMSEARLTLSEQFDSRASVLEITRSDSRMPSPGIEVLVQRWSDAGIETSVSAAPGPPFWQTTEIEIAPRAIKATVEAFRGRAE